MIGFLYGEVLFSDGNEIILQTPAGIGYQVNYNKVLVEGSKATIYVSQIISENAHTLYGFSSLRTKKLFEMLLTVSGIGGKSAYALICSLGVNEIITAVTMESKSTLTKAPGIGNKSAAQIVLDLSGKIDRVKMYSDSIKTTMTPAPLVQMAMAEIVEAQAYVETPVASKINQHEILNDALMACKELGFKEDKVIPIAQKILAQNLITKPEQLIHLVLKEI
jgi:Holliday junction DNA helicase RuvA